MSKSEADVIDCHRSSIPSVTAINVLVVLRRRSQTAPRGRGGEAGAGGLGSIRQITTLHRETTSSALSSERSLVRAAV